VCCIGRYTVFYTVKECLEAELVLLGKLYLDTSFFNVHMIKTAGYCCHELQDEKYWDNRNFFAPCALYCAYPSVLK
jgi:hypothetical protein